MFMYTMHPLLAENCKEQNDKHAHHNGHNGPKDPSSFHQLLSPISPQPRSSILPQWPCHNCNFNWLTLNLLPTFLRHPVFSSWGHGERNSNDMLKILKLST